MYGFSVVDVGGNWLRISRGGDAEPEPRDAARGLPGVVEVAARLADAKGDDAGALRTLEHGLDRHPDAAPADRAQALLFRAELALRLDDAALSGKSLAEARALDLDPDAREALAPDFAHVEALLRTSDEFSPAKGSIGT